jgi:heme exporter protein B
MQELGILIRKELISQIRSQSNLPSIILYVLSTTFIVFTAFVQVNPKTWITLYWIIVVLASANAAQQSFDELKGIESLYYYQLSSVGNYFAAKVSSTLILIGILSILTFIGLGLFAGVPIRHPSLFLLTNILAWVGLAFIFSFLSFIIVKVEGRSGLLPLLAFPLLLPLLMEVIKLSSIAAGILMDTEYSGDLLLLAAIDCISIAISLLLIRYLWQA